MNANWSELSALSTVIYTGLIVLLLVFIWSI